MTAPTSSSPDKKAAGGCAAINSLEPPANSCEALKAHSMVSVEVKEKQHAIFNNQKSTVPDPESLVAAEPPRVREPREVCELIRFVVVVIGCLNAMYIYVRTQSDCRIETQSEDIA